MVRRPAARKLGDVGSSPTGSDIFRVFSSIFKFVKIVRKTRQRFCSNFQYFQTNFGVPTLFSHVKDRVRLEKRSSVIYRIPCENCDSVYIGETMQYLGQRIRQHKNDVSSKNEKTALGQHAFNFFHNFNFNSTAVLANENHNISLKSGRFVKCMVEIIKDKKCTH